MGTTMLQTTSTTSVTTMDTERKMDEELDNRLAFLTPVTDQIIIEILKNSSDIPQEKQQKIGSRIFRTTTVTVVRE